MRGDFTFSRFKTFVSDAREAHSSDEKTGGLLGIANDPSDMIYMSSQKTMSVNADITGEHSGSRKASKSPPSAMTFCGMVGAAGVAGIESNAIPGTIVNVVEIVELIEVLGGLDVGSQKSLIMWGRLESFYSQLSRV